MSSSHRPRRLAAWLAAAAVGLVLLPVQAGALTALGASSASVYFSYGTHGGYRGHGRYGHGHGHWPRYHYRHHHRWHPGWDWPGYYAPHVYVPHVYAPPVRVYPPVEYVDPPAQVLQELPAPEPQVPLLEYESLRGQGRAQMHSERLACEREAIEATRPPAGSGRRTRTVTQVPYTYQAYPQSPLGPAAGGAALGALGGAIAGDAGLGAAIGAAVGAAGWLLGATAEPPRTVYREQVVETLEPAVADPGAIRRALVGCMEARGYRVR